MHNGKTKGPYPVLLQEMYDEAKVSCYIYNSSRFIKYAKNCLKVQVSDETIEEAENREKYITEQESVSNAMMKNLTAIPDEVVKNLKAIPDEVVKNLKAIPDEVMKDLIATRGYDAAMKAIREEYQRAADAFMEPILDERRRTIDNIIRNVFS